MMHRAWIETRYALQCVGYWLRPYDSHLDARCWRWRRPACRPFYIDTDGILRRGWWTR